MLDLISLAAKNPPVKAFLCVCFCVCVYMCARACCSGCFLLCLSNRKPMWSSTEDREKAFSFHCESFESESERGKKRRAGHCIDSALYTLACCSLFFSPPSPFVHSLNLFVHFSLFSLFTLLCFCCRTDSSVVEIVN